MFTARMTADERAATIAALDHARRVAGDDTGAIGGALRALQSATWHADDAFAPGNDGKTACPECGERFHRLDIHLNAKHGVKPGLLQ